MSPKNNALLAVCDTIAVSSIAVNLNQKKNIFFVCRVTYTSVYIYRIIVYTVSARFIAVSRPYKKTIARYCGKIYRMFKNAPVRLLGTMFTNAISCSNLVPGALQGHSIGS
jgi:hypothetical protein